MMHVNNCGPTSETKQILTVGIDPNYFSGIPPYFDQEGYQFLQTINARQALAMFPEDATDLLLHPDMIIIDIDKIGTDLLTEIRNRLFSNEYPFIMALSSEISPSEKIQMLRNGVDDILVKPVEIDELWLKTQQNINVMRGRKLLQGQKQRLQEQEGMLSELKYFRDDMIGVTVQDLRNPLAIITSNLSELLEEWKGQDTNTRLQMLRDAHYGSMNLLRLVTTLLDVNKLENGQIILRKDSIPLKSFLSNTRRGFIRMAQEKNISIEIKVDIDTQCHFDSEIMHRVVANILSNALRFSSRDQSILIEAKETDSKVIIYVRNKGPRIPDEYRSQLFQKYGLAQTRGNNHAVNLGFGLYFCRLALEAHGGQITLEETEEWPTSFQLQFPKLHSDRVKELQNREYSSTVLNSEELFSK